nr:hypothetical protein GCM10020241_00250 [Streptoalloteichus tenebrarius]
MHVRVPQRGSHHRVIHADDSRRIRRRLSHAFDRPLSVLTHSDHVRAALDPVPCQDTSDPDVVWTL